MFDGLFSPRFLLTVLLPKRNVYLRLPVVQTFHYCNPTGNFSVPSDTK